MGENICKWSDQQGTNLQNIKNSSCQLNIKKKKQKQNNPIKNEQKI